MSTRRLLRHVLFRKGPQDKVSDEVLPLGLKKSRAESACIAHEDSNEPAVNNNQQSATVATFTPPPKTHEPFSLGAIAEETGPYGPDTITPIDTASLTETLNSLNLETSAFSTRELIHATLEEAKIATDLHVDTIDTTLALLDALKGFSATISKLRKETLEKKQACEEKMAMLNAVGRAVEGMTFAGEVHEQFAAEDVD